MNEEELKKGCGEDFSHPCSAFRMCRKGDLCPICQAKLSQHIETRKEDVEEFNKNIDEFLNKLIKQQTSETPMLSDIEWEEGYNTGVRDIISFVLDYFKSSLEKDDDYSQQPEELTCQGGREMADRNNISSGYLGTGKPKEYLPADNKLEDTFNLRRGVCEGCTEESCKDCYYNTEDDVEVGE